MGLMGRQFGRPSGLPGRVVGGLMARGNRAFNVEVVRRLTAPAFQPCQHQQKQQQQQKI